MNPDNMFPDDSATDMYGSEIGELNDCDLGDTEKVSMTVTHSRKRNSSL